MSKIQSHAECAHASSKSARAKCRRDRAKMADAFSSLASEFGNVQIGTAPVVEPEPVFEPVRVTAENWRDFRETRVRIAVRLTDDEESEVASGVHITGWGKQWINYASPIGKTKRTAVSCTYAETLPPVE